MKLVTTTLIMCMFSFAVHAKFYAKVIKMRGKISKLSPGDKTATWVKQGDILKEDTSLVSKKGSFAKIQILRDKSSVTLGPNSKLVVTKVEPKQGSVISVLTGTIRAEVNKQNKPKNGKSKMYVKTQTAAMGIRGTEFVVAVNQENKVTSLVTLEGEVAMAKLDDAPSVEPIETIVEDAVDKAPPEDVEVVRKGRASTSYLHKEEVTPPTKVNPVQLVALKENKNLDDKVDPNAKAPVITEEVKKELYAPDTEEEKAEGRDKIPENGSVVDLKSAIFIPPVDKDLDIGKVDPKSGQFIAANDVKLDPVKGFVPKDKKSKKAKELAKELNKVVEYKELPRNYAPSSGHTVSKTRKRENSHEIGATLGLGATQIKSKEATQDSSELATVYVEFNYLSRLPSTYGHTYLVGTDLLLQSYDSGQDFEQAQNDEDVDRLALNIHLGVELQQLGNFRLYFMTGARSFFTPVIVVGGLSQRSYTTPKMEIGTILNMTDKYTVDAKFSKYWTDDSDGVFLNGGHSMSLDFRKAYSSSSWTWGVKTELLELDFIQNLQDESKILGYFVYKL
jgi:hypothetical protein